METRGNRTRSIRDLDYVVHSHECDDDNSGPPMYNPNFAADEISNSCNDGGHDNNHNGEPPRCDPTLFKSDDLNESNDGKAYISNKILNNIQTVNISSSSFRKSKETIHNEVHDDRGDIGPPVFDPNATFPEHDDHDNSDDEDEDEDDLPRTRARSRSVMDRYEPENEKGIVLIDAKSIQEIAAAAAANASSNATGEGALLAKPLDSIIDRKGPLLPREVEALKKGIEESVRMRSASKVKEETEEMIAAEEEKQKRLSINKLQKSNMDPRRVKILMLGDSGVGKSSLMLRYTADTFSTDLIGTVGVNFKNKKVHINDECLMVQVWDTAGQEQFHRITSSYYKSAHGIMVVFDVSDKKSQENVEYWIKNIKSHASDTVHVVLIGNKIDLRAPSAASSTLSAPNKAAFEGMQF